MKPLEVQSSQNSLTDLHSSVFFINVGLLNARLKKSSIILSSAFIQVIVITKVSIEDDCRVPEVLRISPYKTVRPEAWSPR